jgi:PAS domain S-box-containing protein
MHGPNFRLLFESAPGLYLVLTTDLTIVAVSDAYLAATMTRRDEILGRHLFDVFPDNPDDPTAEGSRNLRASLDRVQATKALDRMAIQKYDIRKPESEGGAFEVRYWSPVNSPVIGPSGEVAYILHRVEDVTAQVRARNETKQTETQLRLVLEQERLIVEAVEDYAFLTLDPDGTVMTWNVGARRLHGWEAGEIIGRNVALLYPAEDAAAGLPSRVLATAAAEGRAEANGWRLRKDGSRFWADVLVTALRDEAGELIGFSRIVRDFTERKRAETLLAERSAELERVNRELETFAYSVSHDLRAPLRSIAGFAQILNEDYAETLGVDGRESLGRIRAATKRMAELIDDLLALSRVTRLDLQPERVDLSALARRTIDDAQRRQPNRPVAATIADGAVVQGDPRLLALVLENLVGNAFKFTARTPEPRVEFGIDTGLGEENGNGAPVYFVRDNGAGFDMAYADKLFGPFQRLHSASEFPGTGVGLATVQRVLHRHNGRIWAESAPNAGATFYFTFMPEADTGENHA